MNWKMVVKMLLPLVRMAGEAKKAEDENTTGADDAQGIAMVFAVDLLEAVVLNRPLPKAPTILK